jgi:hypothetical protein
VVAMTREQDDDIIQTEEAIQQLRRYFHIYEGWDYITLRCGICEQMFGIKPNAPIMERSSLEMLMHHAKAHNKLLTGPLDYSRRYSPSKGAVRSLEAQDELYDATDDFSRSIDDCYRAIRERVRAGGEGWEPP